MLLLYSKRVLVLETCEEIVRGQEMGNGVCASMEWREMGSGVCGGDDGRWGVVCVWG